MKLHFVIVNFNSGNWLDRAIASIVQYSSELSWQATVVDNCSTDDSMQIAQSRNSDTRIEWLLNEKNVGFAAANNQVLSEVEADYFILMNPDCELRPLSIETVVAALEHRATWGIASCRIVNEDGSLQATCRRRFPTPLSALSRMLGLGKLFSRSTFLQNFDHGDEVDAEAEPHEVEAISGAFMVVRQRAMQQVGLLDEDYFMHCEDLDWCMRFANSAWQVGFVPAAVVLHAKGVSSKARPIRVLWTLHKGMNRFFDKFYKDSYAWPIRYGVKVGIGVSFILRASASYVFSLRH